MRFGQSSNPYDTLDQVKQAFDELMQEVELEEFIISCFGQIANAFGLEYSDTLQSYLFFFTLVEL